MTVARTISPRITPLPPFLRRLHTDEYAAPAYSAVDLRVLRRTAQTVDDAVERTGLLPPQAELRRATAAGLRALNDEHGAAYYDVPPDATTDTAVAERVFGGDEVVVDVQTHFCAPHSAPVVNPTTTDLYRAVMPDWWTEMDDLVSRDLAEYIRNVFLETENAVAILTSGPGVDDSRTLFNDEMRATRELLDRFAGTGRLLNHAVVHADLPEEVDAMAEWTETIAPAGWKVYTPGRIGPDGWTSGWQLDDHEYGFPFLERARASGIPLVCAHKGISLLVDNGSPRDIGPAARAFPDLNFLVYHSGYEFAVAAPMMGNDAPVAPPEGPYTDESAHAGVNRLITSLREAGIGPGANVYAELGTTWFSLIRRPLEAAHVLGKLIAAVGEDNVIWGTDSIWYGSAQPLIDAFRVFQIPDELCERYGYAKLTPEVRAKILGRNAAAVYGIDLDEAGRRRRNDDLAWCRALLEDYQKHSFAGLR